MGLGEVPQLLLAAHVLADVGDVLHEGVAAAPAEQLAGHQLVGAARLVVALAAQRLRAAAVHEAVVADGLAAEDVVVAGAHAVLAAGALLAGGAVGVEHLVGGAVADVGHVLRAVEDALIDVGLDGGVGVFGQEHGVAAEGAALPRADVGPVEAERLVLHAVPVVDGPAVAQRLPHGVHEAGPVGVEHDGAGVAARARLVLVAGHAVEPVHALGEIQRLEDAAAQPVDRRVARRRPLDQLQVLFRQFHPLTARSRKFALPAPALFLRTPHSLSVPGVLIQL